MVSCLTSMDNVSLHLVQLNSDVEKVTFSQQEGYEEIQWHTKVNGVKKGTIFEAFAGFQVSCVANRRLPWYPPQSWQVLTILYLHKPHYRWQNQACLKCRLPEVWNTAPCRLAPNVGVLYGYGHGLWRYTRCRCRGPAPWRLWWYRWGYGSFCTYQSDGYTTDSAYCH